MPPLFARKTARNRCGDAAAVIYVTCDANFGEIQIKYV